MGLEPTPMAWKAIMLTIEHHTRIFGAGGGI